MMFKGVPRYRDLASSHYDSIPFDHNYRVGCTIGRSHFIDVFPSQISKYKLSPNISTHSCGPNPARFHTPDLHDHLAASITAMIQTYERDIAPVRGWERVVLKFFPGLILSTAIAVIMLGAYFIRTLL